MKIITKHLIIISALLFCQAASAGVLINTNDYEYWRQLAETDQFYMDMKKDAIRTAQDSHGYFMTKDVMGANSLAYILDPENKKKYVKNIKSCFNSKIDKLVVKSDAVASSVLSHELFFALLALDVIGDDLDNGSRKRFERMLESKIMKLVIGKWDPHAWAMRMLWFKYVDDVELFTYAKEEWEEGLSEHFTFDGVSPAGSTYCVQRWTNVGRSAKNLTMDIMEYMGYNEYYTNHSIKGHQEFLFGYAIAPFGYGISFGDSRHTSLGVGLIDSEGYIASPTTLRAARFSEQAYQSSMWVLSKAYNTKLTDIKLKGYLPNYLIMAGSAANNNPLHCDLNDGALAPSRIFDSYASLVTAEQSTDALMIAMQTLANNEEYHTHYEVNAIGLAGYGEILLRNAGYDGPGRDVSIGNVTASFDYLHSYSEGSSCVMLAGEQHTSKTGEGIIDGFTGYDIEYFRGSTGKDRAIKGSHLRDVVFMQPANGANGYYIVMDHVEANKADEVVNVVWHPNAPKLQPLVAQTEYLSVIKPEGKRWGPTVFSQNQTTLKTFLATEPNSIDIKTTVNQESRRQLPANAQTSYVAEYMMANYVAKDGKVDVLTVLFPADKNHAMGDMKRVKVGDYSGAEIIQANIKDIALVSGGTTAGQYLDSEFQGEDVVYRKSADKLISYLVRGTSFRDGAVGFSADSVIAIHLKAEEGGMSGVVSASLASTITLFYPELKDVKIDGEVVEILSSDQGSVTVKIPAGKYALELR